jgi:DNA-binding XRE family transcriptional regulator
MVDPSELTPDAQARIKAKEAAVDQLLHEVSTCENLLRRLDWLDYAEQFTVDASGASFEREDRRAEARETRKLFLKEAVRVLFDSLAEEYWSVLAPDVDKFSERLREISDYVLHRCGARTELAPEAQARVLEWKKRAYQQLAETQTQKAARPAGVASNLSKRRTAHDILTEAKIKRRLTHEKLAEKMDIDRKAYFALKNGGKKVSETTYRKAATFLGCEVSDLKPAE